MRHTSVSSVESAPRRIRSTELLKLRARFGVAAFGVLCSALLFGGNVRQARAGWVLDHCEQDGGTTLHVDAPLSGGNAVNQSFLWTPGTAFIINTQKIAPIAPVSGVGALATVGGKFRGFWRWQPSPGQPLPPTYVNFLITAYARATATANSGSTADLLPSHINYEVVSSTAWGQEGTVTVNITPNGSSNAIADVTKRVVVKVEGNLVATPWIHLKASSELKSGRWTASDTSGNVSDPRVGTGDINVYANFSAPDNRAVIITSALDESYKKSDDGSLPASEYRDGVKPASGPYAVRNKREDDQSMTVDTVATLPYLYTSWLKTAYLTAVMHGTWSNIGSYASYTWSGTDVLAEPGMPDKAHAGGSSAASAFPSSTKAEVTVRDTRDTSGFTLSNSYTVNWHLNTENWQKTGESPYPKFVFTKAGYFVDVNSTVHFTVEPNQTLAFDIPAQRVGFDWKKGAEIGEVVLNVGASGVGLYTVIAGSTAAVPGAGIVLGLTAAAGVTSLITGDEPAATPGSRVADYAQYKSDMILQQQINYVRAIDSSAYPDELSRCDNPDFVEDAVAEIQRLNIKYPGGSDGRGEEDKFFEQIAGQMRCSGKAGRNRHKEAWKGDEYNAGGYVGLADLDIVRHHSIFYALNWTFVHYGPPGPGTTPTP